MTRNELAKLILSGEGATVEFKRAVTKDIGREWCAFANASGGTVPLDVSDAGKIVGVADQNRLKSRVLSTARSADPPIEVEVESVGQIPRVAVPPQKRKPYSFGGRLFMRDGTSNQQMSNAEVEDMFYAAGRLHFDRKPCPDFSIDNHLDEEIWARFSSRAKIPETMEGVALLRRGLFRLFMELLAKNRNRPGFPYQKPWAVRGTSDQRSSTKQRHYTIAVAVAPHSRLSRAVNNNKAMSFLRASFAPYWQSIQHALFPQLEQVLGPLTAKQQQLVQTLEVIRVEHQIPRHFRAPGRPPKDRAALARAFVAKAVYDMPTTRVLLDRLDTDVALRRICGWERRSEVPSESVFSRAFAEFAATQLAQRAHEALIRETHQDRLVGHLSRDSTAIEAREKPVTTDKAPPPPKRKRGRPKKGEKRPKAPKRLDRQATMSLPEMLDDLPTDCAVGTKKNSKGYKSTWVGYKLHIDVADGQIPVGCILTSASLHDSQAAIPLATMSAERVTNFYDLMDAAYDAEPIREHSRSLGHVPLIDINPRGDKALAEELRAEAQRLKHLGFQLPEQVRYNERTAGERVNGRLKDEFGGRHVRVRGASKVMCHCMFGVLALTADQLVRLVT